MITVNFETGEALEFQSDSFVGAEFKGANLHRALFERVDASDADFTCSVLRNAIFYFATLDVSEKGTDLLIDSKLEQLNKSVPFLQYFISACGSKLVKEEGFI